MQIVRQTNRRLVALLPCHEPKKPCYLRESARSCPNCCKRCLNELKATPREVRFARLYLFVINVRFRKYFSAVSQSCAFRRCERMRCPKRCFKIIWEQLFSVQP